LAWPSPWPRRWPSGWWPMPFTAQSLGGRGPKSRGLTSRGSAIWPRMASERTMAGLRYLYARWKASWTWSWVSWTDQGARVIFLYTPCPPPRVTGV